ncbi:DUF934 domain-containing protein [Sinimarinibacterium flocculans]|uniref:DUF934 domain-containing protein n=1 Tax=Sinimarinibacterium flocculans TaxID=985250 RepID=UPI0024929017|nr:DUF934 domain-containing protein [Sinimarinibacterium flocculans]
MGALIRNGRIDDDDVVLLGDDDALPASGRAVVTLARWLAERETLSALSPKVGILLPNTADLAESWPAIADRDLLCLSFPAFGDGRAYSQARLLRERYGFAGEIRATGAAVVVDQAAELLRCGFDAFSLRDDQKAEAFIERLAAAGTRRWYQRPAQVRPVFEERRGA